MGLFNGPWLSKEEHERSVHLNLISRANSLELNNFELQAKLQVAQGRVEELEALRKKELDFYLWDKKLLSRHIRLLENWIDRLPSYRNELTMTTEIPDTLMREGMEYLEGENLLVEEGDD